MQLNKKYIVAFEGTGHGSNFHFSAQSLGHLVPREHLQKERQRRRRGEQRKALQVCEGQYCFKSSVCVFRWLYRFQPNSPPGSVISEGGLARALPVQYVSTGTKSAFQKKIKSKQRESKVKQKDRGVCFGWGTTVTRLPLQLNLPVAQVSLYKMRNFYQSKTCAHQLHFLSLSFSHTHADTHPHKGGLSSLRTFAFLTLPLIKALTRASAWLAGM